jgi:hypothetical protein
LVPATLQDLLFMRLSVVLHESLLIIMIFLKVKQYSHGTGKSKVSSRVKQTNKQMIGTLEEQKFKKEMNK